MTKPIEPKLHNYPVKQSVLAALARNQGLDGPACDGLDLQNVILSSNDLTEEGYARFMTDWEIYKRAADAQEKERTSIKALGTVVTKTVASHIFDVCCQPEESIRDWYTKLKQQSSLGGSQLKTRARQQYRAAVQPLTQLPHNIEAWIQAWEKAMSSGQARQLPEAQVVDIWAHDFFDAVSKLFPEWARTAERVFRARIDDGTLTHRELSMDFRIEMAKHAAKLPVSKVSKGSFGPTFAEGQGKKSKGDAKRCRACGNHHPTSVCYYLFPDNAPVWFTPNPV